MAVNKVNYGNTTIMDITDTTATAADVASGETFYLADGTQSTGTLAFITYYTGSSDPAAATGSNGDIYLKVVT